MSILALAPSGSLDRFVLSSLNPEHCVGYISRGTNPDSAIWENALISRTNNTEMLCIMTINYGLSVANFT